MSSLGAAAEAYDFDTEDKATLKPDPDLDDFRLAGDNILIRQYQPPKEIIFKSGFKLHAPPKIEKNIEYLQNVGRVVQIGRTAWHDPNVKPGEARFPFGFYGEPWAKVGDWVVFPRHTGTRIKIKGVDFLMLKDVYVLAQIGKPEDIDHLQAALEDGN